MRAHEYAWRLPLGQLRRLGAVLLSIAAVSSPVIADVAAPEARGSAPPKDRAGTFVWRVLPVGAGGWVTGGSADLKGKTRIVRTDTHGGYRWEPALDRWVPLLTSHSMPVASEKLPPGGGIEELAVAPNNPNRIFVSFANRIWRSDDGGRRFSSTGLADLKPDRFSEARLRGTRIAISASVADTALYASRSTGVLRTVDGGNNWARIDAISSESQGDFLVWGDPNNPGRMLSATEDGRFFATDDDGQSWTSVPADSGAPIRVQHGVFSHAGKFLCAASNGLWVLENRKWTHLRASGVRGQHWATLVEDPSRGTLYALTIGGELHRSVDHGKSWQIVHHATEPEANDVPWLSWKKNSWMSIASAFFDPVHPGRLWIMEGSGVWYADVNDQQTTVTWKSRSRGIEQLVATDVVATDGGAVLLSAWDFGIHRKDAATMFSFSRTFGPTRRFNSAWSLASSGRDPKFVVASVADHRQCCESDGQAVMSSWSDDEGETWHRFESLPLHFGPAPSRTGTAMFGSIVVASGDVNNLLWLPAGGQPLHYSRDRGKSWKPVALGSDKVPTPGSHGDYYLWRRVIAADPHHPSAFYYVHTGEAVTPSIAGVWRSEDGGQSWQKMHGTLHPQGRYNARLVAMADYPGHLVFTPGPLDGMYSPVFESRDGGRSWYTISEVSDVTAIADGSIRTTTGYDLYLAGRVGDRYGIWRRSRRNQWQQIGEYPAGSIDRIRAMAVGSAPRKDARVFLATGGSGWLTGESARCTPKRTVSRGMTSPQVDQVCFRAWQTPGSSSGDTPSQRR